MKRIPSDKNKDVIDKQTSEAESEFIEPCGSTYPFHLHGSDHGVAIIIIIIIILVKAILHHVWPLSSHTDALVWSTRRFPFRFAGGYTDFKTKTVII